MTKVSTPGWAWMIGGAAAAAVSALALGAGYVWWQQQRTPISVPPVETATEPAAEQPRQKKPGTKPTPAVTVEAAQTPAPKTELSSESAPIVQDENLAAEESGASVDAPAAMALSAPVLDLVRLDPEGTALVAGSAPLGSDVSVLLDGGEVSRAEIGPEGEFVVFVDVPPIDRPQVLSLRAERDGQVRVSEESFILAPLVAPAPQVALKTAEADTAQAAEEGPTKVATEASVDPHLDVATEAAVARPPEAKVAIDTEVVSDDLEDVGFEDAPSDVSSATARLEETSTEDVAAAVIAAVQVSADPVVATEDAGQETVDASQNGQELTPEGEGPARLSEDLSGTDPFPDVAEVDSPSLDVATAAVEETTAEPAEVTAHLVPTSETATNGSRTPEVGVGAQVAVLKADATGLSLVQPAKPVAPELVGQVALDTISYTTDGEVLLKGRSSPEAVVRVYLDNAPVAEVSSAADGRWDTEVLGVEPGIYTLRLDEIEPILGRVQSRIEIPFKRESPEVLAQTGAVDGAPDKPRLKAVTVQQGDTLWAISDTVYGDGLLYVRVFAANRDQIRNPDLIYPGQIFNLPE